VIRILAIMAILLPVPGLAAEKFITLASTTSTQNSGLFDHILPMFFADTGIGVRVVAVGTGQAIRIAENGDADALLVHHRPSELAFIANGFGIERRDVMYNDFVIVGPGTDPAMVAAQPSAPTAFLAIAKAAQKFASRGDDSGTHKKEREIWAASGVVPSGEWYLETGSGMGATLNLSQSINAYTLTDRGTWITFGNKGALKLLYSGDPTLFNPYSIILVNPARYSHVKTDLARRFALWLVSDRGQSAIAEFRIERYQAFCPNATPQKALDEVKAVCPSPNPLDD